jgi:hypothetical protein
MKVVKYLIWNSIFFGWITLHAQELVTYPAPKAVIYAMHNDDYTVRVRKPGGTWQDLFEYKVKVDMDRVQDASMVYFDFSGSVEISVRKNNGNVQSVRIRPAIHEITPAVNGNVINFLITRPGKFSVEFDGDKLHNLHVFANPLETIRPNGNDSSVIYFGPGLHTPPEHSHGTFRIPSGKTVYIAGGAVVRGRLLCDSVKNIRITGRGVVDQPSRGVEITHSKNITVEGIIFVNPKHYTIYGGASRNLTIRNIKSFSSNGWSDGIDLMSCSDVVIEDVFMRNSDDCIAIYGHRWNFYGNARNISIMNSTLWADIAHPTNIGIHGNTAIAGDTIENIIFRNIDILEQDEDDPEYQGCMAINAGDFNLVRNVRYENIRIDDFEEGQLLNLRIVYNKQYNTGPGRGIENIYFKDIYYTGLNQFTSRIAGLDKDHCVKAVTFDNLRINGKLILDPNSANIEAGIFSEQIVFKK